MDPELLQGSGEYDESDSDNDWEEDDGEEEGEGNDEGGPHPRRPSRHFLSCLSCVSPFPVDVLYGQMVNRGGHTDVFAAGGR